MSGPHDTLKLVGVVTFFSFHFVTIIKVYRLSLVQISIFRPFAVKKHSIHNVFYMNTEIFFSVKM